MTEYISDSPISRPLRINGVKPDRNFNGVMWSFQYGLCFYPVDDFNTMRLPNPPTAKG